MFYREINENRKDAAAAVVNGKIFCCGGLGRDWDHLVSTECYDPSSDVWTKICNMPAALTRHRAVGMNGNLIVIEGNLNKMWILGTTNKNAEWTVKSNMSLPCNDFDREGINYRILFCGGNSEADATDDVKIFDGKVWTTGPKLKTALCSAVVTPVPMDFVKCLK